jgi:hypothetical protein
MNGNTEQGIESLGGTLYRRPRHTPGCSAMDDDDIKDFSGVIESLLIPLSTHFGYV